MESYSMNEDEAYLEIAKRFIDSCDKHIKHKINYQEVLGFKSYHAFESIAGAYNSHYHHIVPKSHEKKLNSFILNCRHDKQVDGLAIAQIAIMVNSLRNKCLYPQKKMENDYITPQKQISLTDAKKLVSRINGIIRKVEKII